MEGTKPIQEAPFKNEQVVICGRCQGRKVVRTDGEPVKLGSHETHDIMECPFCQGAGILHRVTKGVVELYLVH